MWEGLSALPPQNPVHLLWDSSDEWGAEASDQHGVTKNRLEDGRVGGGGLLVRIVNGQKGGDRTEGGSRPGEVRPSALRRDCCGLKSMCC